MPDHALLSPSSAARWLACTPSARLEEQFPDTASEAAEEGTVAHHLGETLILFASGKITKRQFNAELKQIENGPYYNAEMQDLAEGYRDYVLTEWENAKKRTSDAELIVEAKLNLTDWVEEGFGTADAQIIADKTLRVIDFKYGKGVSVSATDNKQMMLYALGALKEAECYYDIDSVSMTIYQPRLGNVSTFEMGVKELRAWAESELVERAASAYAGEGEFVTGGHCLFCRAKVRCRAYAEKQLEMAKYEFKDPPLLDEDEIADILKASSDFKSWISKIETFALDEAVNNGKKWNGFKLVEGRSVRAYKDQDEAVKKLMENGIPEAIIYERKVLGITAMEKAITKKVFTSLLSELIVKPQGKPTLVDESDKRPEWNSTASAVNDFS